MVSRFGCEVGRPFWAEAYGMLIKAKAISRQRGIVGFFMTFVLSFGLWVYSDDLKRAPFAPLFEYKTCCSFIDDVPGVAKKARLPPRAAAVPAQCWQTLSGLME